MLGCFLAAGLIVTIVYSIDCLPCFEKTLVQSTRRLLNHDCSARSLALAFEFEDDTVQQARRE
jgi:hypothetical protein